MLFTKGDAVQIERVKAYVDGGSDHQSCTSEQPFTYYPECTIDGLAPGKGYVIVSEQCKFHAAGCVNIGRETMWTLPSGKHFFWLTGH